MGNICYTAGWHEHWPRQLFPSADGHPRPFSSQSGEYPVFVREASSPDSLSLEPRPLICRLKLLVNHMVASLDEREAKSKATILDKPMWGLIYLPGPQTPTNNFSQVANIIVLFFFGGGGLSNQWASHVIGAFDQPVHPHMPLGVPATARVGLFEAQQHGPLLGTLTDGLRVILLRGREELPPSAKTSACGTWTENGPNC